MEMLGQWLLEWRRSTGATQRRVAYVAGVAQSHLCRIEQGRRRPSGVPLARILIALDWLSGGGDPDSAWARVGVPPATARARWAGPRPPAVIGREPLSGLVGGHDGGTAPVETDAWPLGLQADGAP